MREEVLTALQRLQPAIRQDWERRLRAIPTHSPLGAPDMLVHLMEWTLDSIWQSIRAGHGLLQSADNIAWSRICFCGANPLTNYFLSGKEACQAIFDDDTLQLAIMFPGERRNSGLELSRAFDRVAEQEIKTFCSICQNGREFAGENPIYKVGQTAASGKQFFSARLLTDRPLPAKLI